MKEKSWIDSMKNLGAIRLFCSLYLRKSRKGAVTSAQEVDLLFRTALAAGSITPLELSLQMGISKTIVSRLIEHLTGKHLVKKIYSTDDKRSYYLKITETGKQELDAMYYYYLGPLYDLQEHLGNKDYEELIRLIQKANESMVYKIQNGSGNTGDIDKASF